ncbi:MAG: peroxidase-related enzyme [Vicinamibacterales bacterium]
MPYIDVPNVPGIRALLAFRPETAEPLGALAHALLHAPNSLSPGDRELIAAYVSHLNQCRFCFESHAAIAACHLHDEALVDLAVADPQAAPISSKMRELLALAARVQLSGRAVSPEDVARAKREGATDVEIHDTVLIAAAFCMFNRYVDGLGAVTPTDREAYRGRAAQTALEGYRMTAPPA